MKKIVLATFSLVLFLGNLQGTCAEEHNTEISVKIEEYTEVISSPNEVEESMMFSSRAAEELWVDRNELPDYALDFYYELAENIQDESDWLIDISMAESCESGYRYTVTEISETIPFSYLDNGNDDEILQGLQDAVNSALKDNYAEAKYLLTSAYAAFLNDYPEVFWLDGAITVGYGGLPYSPDNFENGSGTVTYTQYIYFYLSHSSYGFDVRSSEYLDKQTIMSDISVRDWAVHHILSGDFPSEGTRFEKVRYINLWLTENNAYNTMVASGFRDEATSLAWECLSALTGNEGESGPVCEGYARAFMVLCRHLGIPCVLVEGKASSYPMSEKEAHMWNYVQMSDEKWYAVDVTWNDPVFTNNDSKKSGYENEDWFLLGANEVVADNYSFIDSHVVENAPYGNRAYSFTNGPVLSFYSFTPDYYSISYELRDGDRGTLEYTNVAVESGEKIGNQIPSVTLGPSDQGWHLMGYYINDIQYEKDELSEICVSSDFCVEVRTMPDLIGQGDEYSEVKPDGIDDRLQSVLIFQDYDGTVLKTQVLIKGESATAPAVAVRDGYEFWGWDKDFSNVQENTIIVTAVYKLTDANEFELMVDGVMNKYHNFSGEKTNDNSNVRKAVIQLETFIEPNKMSAEGYLFAGFFSSTDCTKETAIHNLEEYNGSIYAKFVTEDVMNIKVQASGGIRNSEAGVLRIITTVDSLCFEEVGFKVEIEGIGTKTLSSKTVYSTLSAKKSDGSRTYYYPTMISDESKYFLTALITGIPTRVHNNKFNITPYWKTYDGTVVYGETQTKVISHLPGY